MIVAPVEIGQQVPELSLLTGAGEHVSLAAFRGEATLLIFLRHLG